MKFFLIYNNFFYRDFGNKTRKLGKINSCELALTQDDWLVKTNSFLIGGFIFMLNTDWIVKKQLNVNSINYFYKQY